VPVTPLLSLLSKSGQAGVSLSLDRRERHFALASHLHALFGESKRSFLGAFGITTRAREWSRKLCVPGARRLGMDAGAVGLQRGLSIMIRHR
jgi:hypothetical protein